MGYNDIDKIIDLTYLKQVSNGDTGFIKEMIGIYLKETPLTIINLEKHLKNKDWKMLREVIHKMKPSFSFFGLNDMYDLLDSMEEYSEKEIHLNLLPDMIDKVKLVCTQTIMELENQKDLSLMN